jgi:hypothetical protein
MGQITVLSLQDEADGEYFAIPVTNFPIIPIGSLVTLKLDGYIFENLEIKGYSASNYLGNAVEVTFDTNKLQPGEPTLNELKASMRIDEKQAFGCRYVYDGEPIAFG